MLYSNTKWQRWIFTNIKWNFKRHSEIIHYLCMHAKSLPTLCDPVVYSLPGSSVHGILQARILEWVAISSSRGSPNSVIKLESLTFPALARRFFTTRATWEALIIYGYAHIWSNYLEYCKGRINIQESCSLRGKRRKWNRGGIHRQMHIGDCFSSWLII